MGFTLLPTFLSGGVDATEIYTRFEKKNKIAVSYYDEGVDNQGHESELSEVTEVLIDTPLIKVSISANSAGNLKRYTRQRVYCQMEATRREMIPVPVGANSYQMNPDNYFERPVNSLAAGKPDAWVFLGEIPNEPGASKTFSMGQVGYNFFKTDINNLPKNFKYEDEIQIKEGKTSPPPCTMFEMSAEKIFCAGNLKYPTRIWYSYPQSKQEIIPESFNSENYLELASRKEEGGGAIISSLKSNESRLIVHSARGITFINSNTYTRQYSRSDFGALNPACDSRWNNASSPYFASDGVLYELQNQQALRSELANTTAWQLMRNYVDLGEIKQNPWRANMEADATNKLVFIWVPCFIEAGTGSRLAGFIFDSSTKTLVGPLTGSGIISSTKANPISPQIVGLTEDGSLVVIDLSGINADSYNNVINPFNDPKDGRFMVISTQLLDMGTPYEKKAFLELQFTTVEGSYCKNLIIEIENDEGHKKTFNYGKVDKARNKCVFVHQGCALRITMKFECDLDDYFSMRDITLAYDTQKFR